MDGSSIKGLLREVSDSLLLLAMVCLMVSGYVGIALLFVWVAG
ncbi:MAG: hypothetical protein ACRDI1_02845 [Actinomycetota bacterium]|jgi:hypothetical protein